MSQLQELEHHPAYPRGRQRVTMDGFVIASGWLVLCFLLSMSLVRAAIGYAHRRGMLDQPGQRRSHLRATARGGGIGVVLAVVVSVVGASLVDVPVPWPLSIVAGLVGALLLVAAVGWWDDHHSLPVLPRLAIQLVAVICLVGPLLASGLSVWWLLLLLPAGMWCINLHNFMDGIDALLAQQAVFVGVGLAALAWSFNEPVMAYAAASVATATAGFWIFNRPPARIFMGDVGSGSVGLLLFGLSVFLWWADARAIWPVMILLSPFATDASLTLLTRVLRGRRWYSAHREHLYQWLVRRGMSHGRVDAAYMGWNLLVVAPAVWLAASHSDLAITITIVIYLTTAIVWLGLKRRLVRRPVSRESHVAG